MLTLNKGAIEKITQQFPKPSTKSTRKVLTATHSNTKHLKRPNLRQNQTQPESIANIKESHVTEPSRRKKRYVRAHRSPFTSDMHKLRQTHPTRHRIHKIPLPQLRRNPNQTRRKMQKIRSQLQVPKMQLHRTIERFNSWAP